MPLSVRLAPARFLDPLFMLIVALGVLLYLVFREAPALGPRGRRLRAALGGTWGLLWVVSMPAVSNQLTRWVEMRGPDLGVALAGKDPERVALVVLGAGLQSIDESLPPRERLDAAGTRRVLTASRLWHERRFGLVIVSGAPLMQAEGMRDLLVAEGVPADRVVLEDRSLDTRQNALYSAAILRERGTVATVIVTSATHLRRSVRDFASAGVVVIPAAAEVAGRFPIEVDHFLPSSPALTRTHICLHEILGYVRG